MKKKTSLALALSSLLLAFNAHATVIDGSNDLLSFFTGDHNNKALDILSADVTFNASSSQFMLHITSAGPIAGVAGAAYIFGFDVGGTVNSPFGMIGEPTVAFNKTATLKSDGTGTVGAQSISVQINGDEISAIVPLSLLPSNLATPGNYHWSLWSIDSRITGNGRNADFAPDGNADVTVVPEPSDSATMLTGLALLGFVLRRRFKQ